jgi:hypothetical protein
LVELADGLAVLNGSESKLMPRWNIGERGQVELGKILTGHEGLKSYNDIVLVAELEEMSHQRLSAITRTDCWRQVV